ncbi:MAG: DNA cytosine methyltransferase, partial [Actinomycetota bacterium]|nr:DNA cytosine methyltransferase [Actinomycetota bacterium]
MSLTMNRDSVTAGDLFCGYGGTSIGAHAAGVDLVFAANHEDIAIETHNTNFPDAFHIQADLSDETNPLVRNKGKMVPGRYIDPADLPAVTILYASPSCKFHSLANAKKLYREGPQARLFDDGEPFDEELYANSERSRVTMLAPLRYASTHAPEVVIIENVVEAAKWGPGRDGSTFRWWLNEWDKLGYDVECLFLNSMFFPPTPQSRDRMYVVCWRKGNRRPDLDYQPRALCTSDICSGEHVDAVQTWKRRTAAWPIERWGKYGQQYDYRCPTCRAPVQPVAWPAYSAIDFTDLGPMIDPEDRARLGLEPLAASTFERARRALTKFRHAPPVLVPLAYDPSARPVTDPMRSLATHGDRSLVVQPQLSMTIRNYGDMSEAKYRGHHGGMPFGAFTTTHSNAIATLGATMPVGGNDHERPGQTRARSLDDAMFTLTGTQNFGVVHDPALVEMRGGGSIAAGQHHVIDPMHVVTAGGLHHGLVAATVKQNGGAADTTPHPVTDPLGTITSRD